MAAKKECVMTPNDKPVTVESVKCDVCLKEVPVSEATVPEASDYFVHFCGLECYAKWKEQGQAPKDQGSRPDA